MKTKAVNLILISGIIWFFVGSMLAGRGLTWLNKMTENQIIITTILGLIFGVIKYLFIFKKTGKKNIDRINSYGDSKVQIYKIYTRSTYFLVVFMMFFGITLRRIEAIPRYILFPIYVGIGLAMIILSVEFLVIWIKNK